MAFLSPSLSFGKLAGIESFKPNVRESARIFRVSLSVRSGLLITPINDGPIFPAASLPWQMAQFWRNAGGRVKEVIYEEGRSPAGDQVP
jgi:hypothetical protein